MKRTMLLLAGLVAASVVAAGPVEGQGPSVHFGGGIAMGAGDLGDGTDTGWLGFVGVDMPIRSMVGFAIGATASYAHIPYEGGADDATNIPALLAELSYLLGATSANPLKAYLRAGAGVMQHRYDPGNSTFDSESETKAGFGAGGGLLYAMRQVSPFIGAHYFTGGSDTSYYTVYVGVSIGGSGGSAAAIRRAIGR